ncbi:MAG: lipid-A-disaccharide synthase [Bryobacteraceae bacterium]|nr:lipid-A-disaccharide synthase [Bryobacterales bacterium]MEB2360175.1 lipid-A-disaccharide synthase [Bryobacterales bacterium]NUM99714.1 lipid-A-disaccharide synthase [Bryobacteraceae bacterium]
MRLRIFVSAGEASGDSYAASLVRTLRSRFPSAEFYGCAGGRMQAVGVRAILDAGELSVVGLVEVIRHLPRIYGRFRELMSYARRHRPDIAVLTDSPDFNLPVARRLHREGVPVVYLVAPQVWAWRRGRLSQLRRNVDRLLCIFPFEEQFFKEHNVAATYIGHPLAGRVMPCLERGEFFRKHRIPSDRPVIAILPGSRTGEISRHLPPVLEAVNRLNGRRAVSFLLAAPAGFSQKFGNSFYTDRIGRAPIQVIEGETWDVVGHSDLALAASGTIATETALLGVPMITFYKVNHSSWLLGKLLVRVPFYTMVNLVAGRAVVPELMQSELTGERLAREAERLLDDESARGEMRLGLRQVATCLTTDGDPMERAADIVQELLQRKFTT